jgi:peptide/nickel transport system substrate-binding protein
MKVILSNSTSAINKILAVVVAVIIIVAAIIAVLLFTISGPLSVSFSISSSGSIFSTGQSVPFSVNQNSSAAITSVAWNFGDGQNQTTSTGSASHSYSNGGSYLVSAKVTASQQKLLSSSTGSATNYDSLYPITVQTNLTESEGQTASVPTIDFQPSLNAKEPIFNVGETVHVFGGFLESPGNSNWTIENYAWNFGNGQTQTVPANSSTFLPAQNLTTSYSSPGIYTITLTLTTMENGTSNTYSVTTDRTIAATSPSLAFALRSVSSKILNPGVITEDVLSGGSPVTFDPQAVSDAISQEVPYNIYQGIVLYNGSSTSSYIPVLATQLPSVANGQITPDDMNFTFTIRNNQYFSNGDPVTAYDVWFSLVREIGFAQSGSGLATGGQFAQYLIPGAQNGTVNPTGNASYVTVTSVITYDNASNSVTLHFNRPMNPDYVFDSLSVVGFGYGIVDAKYAASVGAGFSQSNWYTWEQEVNPADYNTAMQFKPVGSGPFMLQSYTPGQSAVLVPNPHYGGVPGIAPVNFTVVINYVKVPETALLQLEDGQADSVGGLNGLPPSDFPILNSLQSQGIVDIHSFQSLNLFFYLFNIYVYKSVETQQLGAGYNEPANYFADLATRYAWLDAFDYSGFLNNILGNKLYNTTFGTPTCTTIPTGEAYAVPCSQLGGLPQQNLKAAEANFSQSAWHDDKITVPIISLTGDTVTLAASEEWAQTLAQISGGNITAKPVQLPHGQEIGNVIGGTDPQAIYWQNQEPGSPDPRDSIDIILKQNVFGFAEGNGWNVTTFASQVPNNSTENLVMVNGTGYTQAQIDSWLNGNLTLADNSANPATRAEGYRIVQEYAIDLGMLTMLYQQNFFWYWRSWLSGVQYQENPVIGGFGTLLYFWITKS